MRWSDHRITIWDRLFGRGNRNGANLFRCLCDGHCVELKRSCQIYEFKHTRACVVSRRRLAT